jgi:hypothetical protein
MTSTSADGSFWFSVEDLEKAPPPLISLCGSPVRRASVSEPQNR